ncbi:hypothetical protein [Streptomyces sp. NPDC019937]|uniref:hypothetical protein n=1 Tax=Streptomyces sp. NPDC019937 TaxID=3154787 RepID=UPI0033DC8406
MLLATLDDVSVRLGRTFGVDELARVQATERETMAVRKDQRRAIVDGPHRPAGVLGKPIEAMLSPDPADRPTSAEACKELSSGH